MLLGNYVVFTYFIFYLYFICIFFSTSGDKPITDFIGVLSQKPNNEQSVKLFTPQGVSDLNFRIIDTDYKQYDIVYGCTSVNNEYPGSNMKFKKKINDLKSIF